MRLRTLAMSSAVLTFCICPTLASELVPMGAMHALALYGNEGEQATAVKPADENARKDRKKADEKKERTKSKDAAAKDDAAKDDASREIREPMRPQATAVLGVMIGKPLEVQAAEVMRVWEDSPAERAGLQAGDQIVAFDGEKISSPEDLRASITHYRPGDKVTLTIRRHNEEQEIKARLGGGDDFEGSKARRPVQQLLSPRPWLGIGIGTGSDRGVKIVGVLPGSPAHHAGIQEGDAIIRVDKTRVAAPADLQAAIAGYKPGDAVQLTIYRDGSRRKIDVKLGYFGVLKGRGDDARELLEWFWDGRFPF